MVKAFAYLRVSGKGQVDGDGFERQALAIAGYAKAHDIKIVATFREEGISGDLEHRPALSAMLNALAANGTKLVLIEKMDRLARKLLVQETILADLSKHGYELVSVLEPNVMDEDPTRTMMRQIFGVIAQYEKNMLVAKMRGAKERIRARGERCEGRKPYGHYEGEQCGLDRMKELRSAGIGYDRIAVQLNTEGIRPRTGERWWGRTVNNILGAQ